ncbi:MAG TPA: SMC-Scp complex subunit ScpB [Candidatus Paceibacterota bacterium]
MDLTAKIEAILFWKAEPLTVADLARSLSRDEHEIAQALETLTIQLNGRGIVLVRNGDEVMLGTAPAMGGLIEQLTKDELARDIGKAGLETLTIVLYRGPVTRAEIDYTRGVNSSFILRNLLVRGLINKITNPADARGFLYRPTFKLLSWLGVKEISELPDYRRVVDKLREITTNSITV